MGDRNINDHSTEHSVAKIAEELRELNFDEHSMFLTHRQATVLALREKGADQGEIAAHLDCTRANVSNIERSARENIEKARATLSFAEKLTAPVRVKLHTDVGLHEIPDRIYEACDAVDVKVNYGAPELMRKIATVSPASEQRGRLVEDLVVTVTSEGEVHLVSASDD